MAALSLGDRQSGDVRLAGEDPHVLVAILNWNRPGETILCLDSVLSLTYQRRTILLIDNGSTLAGFQPIEDWMASAAVPYGVARLERPESRNADTSRVRVLRTDKNLGYAGGNNLAFRSGMAENYDWVLILNNDVTVPPDLLDRMVGAAKLSARVGMVGCRVLPGGRSRAKAYEGGTLLYGLGVYALHRWHSASGSRAVNFVPGCAMLVSTEMLSEIGGFDERYFLYGEDVDLSFRALKAGWKLLVNLDTYVHHDVSRSLGQKSPTYYYYVTRNTMMFIHDRLRGAVRMLSVSLFVSQTLVRLIAQLCKGERRHAAAVVAGLRDYARGAVGEAPRNVPWSRMQADQ